MNIYPHLLFRECEVKLYKVISSHDPDLRVLVGHINTLGRLHARLTVEHERRMYLDVPASCRRISCDSVKYENIKFDMSPFYVEELDLLLTSEHPEDTIQFPLETM
jgi:hypothetical protein